MPTVFSIVEPEMFLDLFVPTSNHSANKETYSMPSNPFTNIKNPTTEQKMYENFPKALNAIIQGSGYGFVATPYRASNAVDSNLAVDCGMYPSKRIPKQEETKGMDAAQRNDFRRVCWSGIDLPVGCKLVDDPFEDGADTGRPYSDKRRDASAKTLSYIELTFHHQHRTFVFMLIFVGVNCRLLRVDRSGLFVTKRFNITKTNFLIEFLWRYTKLSPEARGYDTTAEYISPSSGKDKLAKMMKDRLAEAEKALEEQKAWDADDEERRDRVEEHVVELWRDALDEKWPWWKLRIPDEVTEKDRWFLAGKPSFQAPGVRGRGTRCYIAVELLEPRRGKYELDTKFVHLKDCWRVVADNASDEAMDIRKEGDTLGKLNRAKVERVPTLVAHGDIEKQDTSASPKAWKTVNDKFKCRLKTHKHYRLVVEEVGKPLSDFAYSGELVLAVYDCIGAHYDAMKVKIIHRDISGGNILLYRKKGKKEWHGLLTDWELSKDSEVHPIPRQAGRTGTLQFSAARVLDDPSKPIVVADELECFFHVLIYYAVRFLHHNIPDQFVGLFLNNYFDASSGQTQNGHLTAPALKRASMKVGNISLDEFGVKDTLRFMWVDDAQPQDNEPQNAGSKARAVTTRTDLEHPLNQLIETLLSWFSALYTLEGLKEPTSGPATSHGSVPSQVPRNSKVIAVNRSGRNASRVEVNAKPKQLSPAQLEELKQLAVKLDDQLNVLALIETISVQPFPTLDKGKDKRPEKDYSPCSPETPQFSEVSDFTDSTTESDAEQAEDGDAAVPDGPAPAAFAELAARANEKRATRRATTAASAANKDDPEYCESPPRTPSPRPSRPKRGREDDVKPEAMGKRSRY